jgi:hypothetical protein
LKELKAGDKNDDTASVISGMSVAGASRDTSRAEGLDIGDVKDLEVGRARVAAYFAVVH